MTRRERMERRLEKRREWADKQTAKQEAACNTASEICQRFEFGQPILISHHSEAKARRDQERMDTQLRKAADAGEMAGTHTSKADNIEIALERRIFSDDDNAIEALEARIAKHETLATHMTEINKSFRKYKGDVQAMVAAGVVSQSLAKTISDTMFECPWIDKPYTYEISNLRNRIRADKKRLEEIKMRQARAACAEKSGGVLVERRGGFNVITFAERPANEVLVALKAAGYFWNKGSWCGSESVPDVVKQLVKEYTESEVNSHG